MSVWLLIVWMVLVVVVFLFVDLRVWWVGLEEIEGGVKLLMVNVEIELLVRESLWIVWLFVLVM